MLELKSVTKRYGKTVAVDDLSFTAPDGMVVGFLGQNGAGKTTTLNMMTGYLPPDSGSVLINGTDMLKNPRTCKQSIGYLPERPPLYDEMTVEEYLTFVCGLREVEKRSVRPHITDVAELCGVADKMDKLIANLSKGYRQRVGIAQALCGDPQILILDEPTVGLDPRQVTEIRTLIRQIGETHTVIFSSHIVSEVQQLCQKAVILHRGRAIREIDLRTQAAPSEMRLRLRLHGKEREVLPALKSLTGVKRVRTEPVADSDYSSIELVCAADGAESLQEAVFRLMCGLDVPILEMVQVSDTLEELFLRATANG